MEGIRRIQEESLYLLLMIFLKIFLILARGFADFRLWRIDLVALDLYWNTMARAHRTVKLHDGGAVRAVLQPPPSRVCPQSPKPLIIYHVFNMVPLRMDSTPKCSTRVTILKKIILRTDYDTKQCKNKEYSGIKGHKGGHQIYKSQWWK